MSTRREFARQVVGAIVGVSAIPAFGEKPKCGSVKPLPLCIRTDYKWAPILVTTCFIPDDKADWSYKNAQYREQ